MRFKTILISLIISLKGFSTGLTDTLEVAPNVDSVFAHYVQSQESEVFEGFTIQLFSGDRDNANKVRAKVVGLNIGCLLYTSPSPRDAHESRMPSSA